MNHDNDYHDDINYGNRFPADYYFIKEEDSIKTYQDQVEHAERYSYKPHRTLHNY